ncbi:MAG: aminotransferase class I/II-fold pyridoxal phosphate-dependent enzyme [Planctomycetes bacterium]|nr:aminotransferase class I/II-fold pyridoxal phosphate-dependent enzyme [Planctomycetota bacterium]
MEIRAAGRVASLGAYAFAEVDAAAERLRASGVDVIDFGVGDPTDPTPSLVREAAKRAVDARARSGYPSYVGDPGFRAAAADWMARRFGVRLDPATEVTSTIGSKEGIFHFPLGLVDPGDLVLVPSPGYPPYSRGTRFAGGEPWFYPVRREDGFLPRLDAIPAEVARRARILWINYPNSPSGALAPASFLAEAAAWCRARGIVLASDEAYSEFHFGEERPRSALEQGKEGVISFFSLSKRSYMTGWRVGWAAGDPRIVALLRKVKTNIDSGTPTFVQDAAAAALADESHVEAMRTEVRARRDALCGALRGIGLPDCTPEATLYVWQRVPEGMSGVEFAKRLLDPAVALVTTPGEWISDPLADGTNPGAGHVRFALVPSLEDTNRAAARLKGMRLQGGR